MMTILGALIPAMADAQENTKPVEELRASATSVRSVTPVFSQLVSFEYPRGFDLAFENASGRSYIQEHVLTGESVDSWSQMITLTGEMGMSADPRATPAALVEVIARRIERACPQSFALKPVGKLKVSGYDAFLALVGCGTISTSGGPRNEIALVLGVKGTSDLYTIQWAERGEASSQPPVFDETRWQQRFRQLNPVRVCDKIPGEAPPYPSCLTPSVSTSQR